MKRRIHVLLALTGLLLIATLWTGASWAQTNIARVGIVVPDENDESVRQWLQPFYRTLHDRGWTAGNNVLFELRGAHGDPTGFSEPVAESVKLKVDVLFAVGPAATRAHPLVDYQYSVARLHAQSAHALQGSDRERCRPTRRWTPGRRA